ncbi:MAG: hypothetical protein V8R51_03790 [Clostridia bacterium]
MKEKSQKNKRKSEMNAMFFIILIAAVMFIISTYAWFSTQKNVSITNLQGTVEVAEGLEISLDAQNWSNGIVLGKEEGQLSIIDNAYTGHHNISPTEMLPVSTLGLVSSNTMTDLKMLRGKIENSKILSEIKPMNEQQTDATKTDYPGYFAFDIFLKNSSKNDTQDDILQLNYDSSLEIMDASKVNTGLQNTARVAFVKYSGTSDVMANQATILKETAGVGVGAVSSYISDVAIWEPNSNAHSEYIVTNNNMITWSAADSTAYATKTLDNGKKGFDVTTQMPTYALKESSEGATINDIYKWDGSETKVQKQYVLQTKVTAKASTEDDYALEDGVQDLVSTSNGTTKFGIAPSKISRIRIYVWLEGQDVDCINYASHGGGIKVNIGLVKGATIGSKGEVTP